MLNSETENKSITKKYNILYNTKILQKTRNI